MPEERHARDAPPPSPIPLRAGDVEALLVDGELRFMRVADTEILRRLYVAVRDRVWDTVPGTPEVRTQDGSEEGFAVGLAARHQRGPIDFSWRAQMEGREDGTLVYDLHGIANVSFEHAKVGICIHHPTAGYAGAVYEATTPWGPIEGRLPELIGPQIQLASDGWDLPLFLPCSSLRLTLSNGVRIAYAFDGDLFEMEDQRNWTDATFKTYSTPAYLGYRHVLNNGDHVNQRVTISLEHAPTHRPPVTRNPLVASEGELTVSDRERKWLPPIGLVLSAERPSGRTADLFRALRPAHLRADVDLGGVGWEARLVEALATCLEWGSALELALHLDGDPREVLPRVAAHLGESSAPVARVLVFRGDEQTTNGQWIRLVREELAAAMPGVAVGGGTNHHFAELNRARPDTDEAEVVAYSITPQIHAFDDISVAENVVAQAETVRSARAFCRDRPIAVSPVSLRPRMNVFAESSSETPESPPSADARQATLFGAAWTLASARFLLDADSITYYETVGARGLVAGKAAAPGSSSSPSIAPGAVFPAYHVLRDLCGESWAAAAPCVTRDEPWLVGLALDDGNGGRSVLLANLGLTERVVTVRGAGTGAASVRVLDEANAGLAATRPERFRSESVPVSIGRDGHELSLGVYATARLDTPRRVAPDEPHRP